MTSPVTETIDIAATPEQVYDLVADVSRMGEWSPEATGSRGAAQSLGAGDKFWGTNRRGPAFWVTRCTVRAAERGRIFEFDVDLAGEGISRWTYTFEPVESGCRVTETWVDRRGGLLGPVVKLGGRALIPGDRGEHNRRNMQVTLRRLKETAESD